MCSNQMKSKSWLHLLFVGQAERVFLLDLCLPACILPLFDKLCNGLDAAIPFMPFCSDGKWEASRNCFNQNPFINLGRVLRSCEPDTMVHAMNDGYQSDLNADGEKILAYRKCRIQTEQRILWATAALMQYANHDNTCTQIPNNQISQGEKSSRSSDQSCRTTFSVQAHVVDHQARCMKGVQKISFRPFRRRWW